MSASMDAWERKAWLEYCDQYDGLEEDADEDEIEGFEIEQGIS